MQMDLIIEDYFRRGFANREILTLLEEVHDIKLSLRTLERKLQRNQLWRRRNKTDEAEVASFISQQLQTSGQQHGYRWMHQKCWMAGLITDRETEHQLTRLLDRNGDDLRAHNHLRRRIYVTVVQIMSLCPNVSYVLVSHNFDLESHNFDLVSHSFDLVSHNFDLVSHNHDLVSHNFDLVPHNFDLVSHNFDLVSQNFDLAIS